MPKTQSSILENTVMPDDRPVSAEHLAQLALTLYTSLAPSFGLTIPPDTLCWETLSPEQRACALAVAHRLLRRVDARVRYVLRGTRYGEPLVGKEESTL